MTTQYGGGDAGRDLELMWGGGKQAGRRSRPGLSVERILDAAISVADAEGLEALSMQRVAEQLGFTTMALYRHVPGKAELVDAMVDAVCGDPPALEDVGGGWRGRLELWARENQGLFRRHPWVLRVTTSRRLMGPNELAWFDAGLAAVSGIGLTGSEMVGVVVLINGYVRGLAQVSVDSARAERDTGVGEGRWWSAYAGLLERFDHDNRYSTLRGLLASGAFDESDDGSGSDESFEFGLQRVLDGVEAFVRSRSAQPGQPFP